MARYIDADAFRKAIRRGGDFTVADILDILEDIPTSDVVEVVWCEECKHYGRKYGDIAIGYCCHTKQSGYCSADHYCSYGERRMSDEPVS